MLDGVLIGIYIVIILVGGLEICRFIRKILIDSKEVEELKRRLSDLEELVKSQNKEMNG